MLTILLTRHGRPDIADVSTYLGIRMDVSLDDQGRRQADMLARRLASVPFDDVVSSPLFRAQETAEIVARGTRPRTDPRLREMDYGAWEGRTHEQVAREDPALRARWEADPATVSCPGGESGDQVAERARAFLADTLAAHKAWHARAAFRRATWAVGLEVDGAGGGSGSGGVDEPGQTILVTGHASMNRVLVAVALGLPVRRYRDALSMDYCSLTVLRWAADAAPDQARLLVYNDTTHLRGLPGYATT